MNRNPPPDPQERSVRGARGTITIRFEEYEPDNRVPAAQGHEEAPALPVYSISVSSGDIGAGQLHGRISGPMLKRLVETGALILGEEPPPITVDAEWDDAFKPAERVPAPEDTIMTRTARKIWLQKRLRDYEGRWEPLAGIDKGLILRHEDLVAQVVRYEDKVYYWAITDKDIPDDGKFPEPMVDGRHPGWGKAIDEGLCAGMDEAMIEASEGLIKILDTRANDANERLTGDTGGA